MYKLIIRPSAADDAKEARSWYEEKRLGLGDEFLEELDSCYQKLENWPLSYAKVKENFRQINLKRFPYIVVYKIYDDRIVVYSVFHTSQYPKKKYKS